MAAPSLRHEEVLMPATLDMSPDELLTTTRAVRRRLDFSRQVPRELIEECLEIALQAPSASNHQGWHFVVVTDPELRAGSPTSTARPGRST
jgi:hypothetical protein